jgi:two-component system response regulator
MNEKPILLVEDNRDDEALMLRSLKMNDIRNEVVIARDGKQALDYLLGTARDRQELPALVLLDLKLPKIDGFEVLRRIRAEERTRFLPVVILTSSNEEQDLVKGYSSGCNSYVRKPVNFDEFLQAARQLGAYWLLLNELPPAR